MGFIRQVTGFVEQKILDERAPIVSEALVQGVLTPGSEPSLNSINEVITMSFVLDVEELAGFVT